MKTKLAAFVLALLLCVSLIPSASAAEAGNTSTGLSNFQKSTTYPGFSDVQSSDWYADSVKQACELGLMNGKGSGKFDPKGTLTLAEAITIASRINAIYQGTDFTPGGNPWYSNAVSYAITAGIVSDGEFTDFSKLATRSSLASMLYKSIPDYEFSQINEVNTIPDVSNNQAGSEYIYSLYRAGILTGSNDGSFKPNDPITRAEVATIINRVVLPENRVTKTANPTNSTGTISGINGDFTIALPEGGNWKLVENAVIDVGMSKLFCELENGHAVLRIYSFQKNLLSNASTSSVATVILKGIQDNGYRTHGERMYPNEAGFVNFSLNYYPKSKDDTSWVGEFACIETATQVYALQTEIKESITESEMQELSDILSSFSGFAV